MIGEPVTTSAHEADTRDDIDASVRSDSVETGRAPRHPWTDRDRARLRMMCEQNLPSADIAERLGRTQRAVDAMSLRLGIRRHESIRPWTECECALILRLHAEGANWAAIAEAVPERSAIAVFRKLSHLVGPAPFKAGCQPRPPSASASASASAAAPVSTPNPPPLLVGPLSRPLRPRPPAPLPPAAVPAGIDAMVRWLRSRDFMVLSVGSGWRVDHRVLVTAEALVEFVNVRRGWLRLPPFILIETEEGAALEFTGTGVSRGAQRFGALSFR